MTPLDFLSKKKEEAEKFLKEKTSNCKIKVSVGMATCEIAAGSKDVMDVFKKAIDSGSANFVLSQKGCVGSCYLEPTVAVFEQGKDPVLYVEVTPAKAQEIIENHLKKNQVIDKYKNPPVTSKQMRVALRNCGTIDPESFEEYLAAGGYQALAKVLSTMKSTDVIAEIKKSGLRGRGGAGFSTGLKWQFTADVKSDEKYFICNADEGDPGAFMDRSVIEGDPQSMIEGMMIGAYAIGAHNGIVYIRAEYPLAVKRLEKGIAEAKKRGFLGAKIMGSDFDFDIEIRLGAGAFVCGEETALMHSIEGYRGMPRPRPPYPAVKGLFDQPTVINNVETLANVPIIISKGGDWYSKMGTEKSKGTKVFALAGKVNNTGLIEVPMGISLKEIIFEVGGGIPNGKKFKAVQTGGPSGGCITEKNLDLPIDYDSLASVGSIMGSGGMIVMDEDTCMVNMARFFLEFTQDESCGKCVPCREGTKRMLEILTRITEGKGCKEDMEKLERLGNMIKKSSLCGLGQSAPNPVLSTLKNFKHEYEAHIFEKKCPSGVCKNLLTYTITDKCVGCTACAKVCPVGAITGKIKIKHEINQEKCIKCGQCFEACKFDAIKK